MHAILLWIISDFPNIGILFGWNMHTRLACPRCNFDASPTQLHNGGKWNFIHHRCFLNTRYRFRLVRRQFDGNVENKNPPLVVTGETILEQVENHNVVFGKELEMEEQKRKKKGKSHKVDLYNGEIRVYF